MTVGPQRALERLSRMLAYMLGRNPAEFGLVPDAEGFVRIRELLQALHEEEGFRHVREADLRALPLCHPSAAIEIEENRIRLRGGPAAAARGGEAPAAPPRLLYAAIRRRAWPFVHAHGLAPAGQAPALLAAEREFALRLGRRIDPEPVVLTVDVRKAAGLGVRFVPQGEGLFQAAAVPPSCLSGPPLPAEAEAAARKKAPAARQPSRILPGGYLPDPARVFPGEGPGSGRERRRGKRPPHGRWRREKPPWKE